MSDVLIKVAKIANTPAHDNSPDKTAPLGVYTANLIIFAVSGVIVSAWILYYTDFFPVIGGLLGLGGLFAWIGFMANLLTAERKKELQARFEAAVLMRNMPWVVLSGWNILFLLWASFQGSVVLDSQRDGTDRSVQIQSSTDSGSSKSVAAEYALSSGGVKKLRLASTWFGSSRYRIKLSGLPAATVKVNPFQRARLVIPSYFLRQPVILVKPSESISGTAANAQPSASGAPAYEFVAWVNNVEKGRIPYRGETVWIGSDFDVAVPSHIRDKWRLELLKAEIPEALLSRWLSPAAIDWEKPLEVGDQVRISILRSDRQAFATTTVQVKPISSIQDFPQEVRLDAAQ